MVDTGTPHSAAAFLRHTAHPHACPLRPQELRQALQEDDGRLWVAWEEKYDQGFEVVVGQMSSERRKSVRVEQFFANGCAVGGHDALLVAVHQPVETGSEEALRVACEQVVPRTAPEHLDDVPPRTSEAAFEFLNDLYL